VKAALDVAETARSNELIDEQIAAGADEIDGAMHRVFYPTVDTRFFNWPDPQSARPWRLWLNQHELISLTSMTSGGVAIPTGNVKLYPTLGPPYKHLELDVSTNSVFSATATWQYTTAVTGLFGYRADEIAVGTLTPSLNATDTAFNPGVPAFRGIGSILRIDSERMIVTGRSSVTTGTTVQAPGMTALASSNLLPVVSAAAYAIGETLLVDGEKMLVQDSAGTNLVVKRAWDGTPIAAHTAGATIYANRQLTVTRGALGTTAAAHSASAPIFEHDPPALIRQLNRAIAVVNLIQTRAGYPAPSGRKAAQGMEGDAPTIGPSDLAELWERAETRFRRQGRKGVV
jgi:hypothetical protein